MTAQDTMIQHYLVDRYKTELKHKQSRVVSQDITRQDYFNLLGYERGSLLFHKLAAPMNNYNRGIILMQALLVGVYQVLVDWKVGTWVVGYWEEVDDSPYDWLCRIQYTSTSQAEAQARYEALCDSIGAHEGDDSNMVCGWAEYNNPRFVF